MAREIKEVAHLRPNLETYGIEHDRIFKKSANLQTNKDEKCVEIDTVGQYVAAIDELLVRDRKFKLENEILSVRLEKADEKLDDAVKLLDHYIPWSKECVQQILVSFPVTSNQKEKILKALKRVAKDMEALKRIRGE